MACGGRVPAAVTDKTLPSYYKSVCRIASCAHRACDKVYSL